MERKKEKEDRAGCSQNLAPEVKQPSKGAAEGERSLLKVSTFGRPDTVKCFVFLPLISQQFCKVTDDYPSFTVVATEAKKN